MFFLKDRKFKPGTVVLSKYFDGKYTVVMVDRLNGLYYFDRALDYNWYGEGTRLQIGYSIISELDCSDIGRIPTIEALFWTKKQPLLKRRRL